MLFLFVSSFHADSKKLWQVLKTLCSDKIKYKEIINMVKNVRLLQNKTLIGDSFNNCFCYTVKNIAIRKDSSIKE